MRDLLTRTETRAPTPGQLALNPGQRVTVRDDGRVTGPYTVDSTPHRYGGDGPWVVHLTGLLFRGLYRLDVVTPLPESTDV